MLQQTPQLRLRSLLLACVSLCSLAVALAQNDVPQKRAAPACDFGYLKNKTGFEIHFDPALLKGVLVGQSVRTQVVVRFPKTGAELMQTQGIRCEGIIPSDTLIDRIEITQVSGLPSGVRWASAQTTFSGGETACIWLEGSPKVAGLYTVDIQSLGHGRFWGVNSSSRCTLRIDPVIVKRP